MQHVTWAASIICTAVDLEESDGEKQQPCGASETRASVCQSVAEREAWRESEGQGLGQVLAVPLQ